MGADVAWTKGMLPCQKVTKKETGLFIWRDEWLNGSPYLTTKDGEGLRHSVWFMEGGKPNSKKSISNEINHGFSPASGGVSVFGEPRIWEREGTAGVIRLCLINGF